METAPLKSFATWARTSLIREVTARITAVLAPGSTERVEQPGAVTALEKAVQEAGGGDKGRSSVADIVAYTWFNRIIALRFMDANGYTGIGVVSPQSGVDVGQPEILAEAKRGVIDTKVASQKTRTTVAGLLDGSRASSDPQGEAYALLLADYCRHWNKAMPFMFEREGDFTELLIPANLLSDDSVLNRAVKVLTEDVCQDVEVIGWLYQFYISERKDEVFAGFKSNNKAGAEEIPAATQLFTPHWIVRYLVENSLGRLWMLNRPSSRLIDYMDYYIAPVGVETSVLKVTKPEELRLLDPACGSGHMLTCAFDLLYVIYEEEGYAPPEIPGLILTHNLYGAEIDARAGSLAAFALTMKARRRQRTYFSKEIIPNICVVEPISFRPEELEFLCTPNGDRHAESDFWNQFTDADTVGSLVEPDRGLIVRLTHHLEALDHDGDMLKSNTLARANQVVWQADFLTPRYAVVVANPPYMGSGNMGTKLQGFVNRNFAEGKADLFSAFILRSIRLVVPGGLVAMITMQSWMFLASFEKLRNSLLSRTHIDGMAHLGTNAFDAIGGDVVSTTAFVLANAPASATPGVFFRLVDGRSESEKSQALLSRSHRFEASSLQFLAVPGTPIAYWLSDRVRSTFAKGKPLAEITPPRNGLQTSDNGRFLRFWWEVSADRTALPAREAHPSGSAATRWFPYNKGGEFRRWYGNQIHVVNWLDDGREVKHWLTERYPYLNGNLGALVRAAEEYFEPHVSWSAVGSGEASFREYPAGLIFDAAANALFPPLPSTRRELLAILNSSVTSSLLSVLAPTINFVVSSIAKLPIVLPPAESEVIANTEELLANSKVDWDSYERSWDFGLNPLIDFREEGVGLVETVSKYNDVCDSIAVRQQQLEIHNNELVADLYDLVDEVRTGVDLERVSLTGNTRARYGAGLQDYEYRARFATDAVADLVSYAIGCMFGRYSLDEPGLILANQGDTVQDYFAKVPSPTFIPDVDNVIPIVDGDWFDDDIVERFRHFLRAAFGEEHFEENLRFVTESLGVKSLRDYFVKSFYKDHVQRYKKRPIYWLFSSPQGSFNALIYMHRYTPSTVSTVLNEYLREFQAKLKASLEHAERSNNGKEADRLRKILLELDAYEHDVLYPLASQNIAIDLDDGVKVNYPKFDAALKKIVGLEASE